MRDTVRLALLDLLLVLELGLLVYAVATRSYITMIIVTAAILMNLYQRLHGEWR